MAEEREEEKKPRRGRRRKASFVLPKRAAVSVRALWSAASEEEKRVAHQTGVAILELWLGQTSRAEVAERLGVPPLRVWQLSQQALSGLVAGLLKQPKARVKEPVLPQEMESPWKLRARIKKLEGEVESLQSLVSLLRDLPGQRKAGPKEGSHVQRKRKTRKTSSMATSAGGRAATSSGSDQSPARRGRPSPRRHRAIDPKLDKGFAVTAPEGGAAAAQREDEGSGAGGGGLSGEQEGDAGGT